MQRRAVNRRQLDVLRWIGERCPERAWPDETHKITSRALETRGLVAVTRRGGSWAAVITEAGQHFLDHGDYPAATSSAGQATSSSSASGSSSASLPSRTAPSRPPVTTPAEAAAPPPPPRAQPARSPQLLGAEQVLDQVMAAGGRVDLVKVAFEAREVEVAARRAHNRPPNRILRFESYGGRLERRYVAYLEEDFSAQVALLPVPVPERVSKPNPAVAAYKVDVDRQMVSRSSLGRAVRVLQGLAAEAVRRGHVVTAAASPRDRYDSDFRRSLQAGQMEITIADHTYGVLIEEKAGKGGQRHDYMSRHHDKLPRWQQVRQFSFVPTGHLSLTIASASARDGRRVTFADGARSTVEDKVGNLLWELEVRALEDARTQERARQAAEQRRRRWEDAMAAAKQELVRSHRRKRLLAEAEAWSRAGLLRSYVADMTRVVEAMDAGKERDRAEEWLAWSRTPAMAEDPLAGELQLPTPPEPTAENLKPFLGGWSFYGPDSRY